MRLADIIDCRLGVHEQSVCNFLPRPCLLGAVHEDCYCGDARPTFSAAKLALTQDTTLSSLQVVGNQMSCSAPNQLADNVQEWDHSVGSNLGVIRLPGLGVFSPSAVFHIVGSGLT